MMYNLLGLLALFKKIVGIEPQLNKYLKFQAVWGVLN